MTLNFNVADVAVATLVAVSHYYYGTVKTVTVDRFPGTEACFMRYSCDF